MNPSISLHSVPFSEHRQLCHLLKRDGSNIISNDGRNCLPGQPLLNLNDETIIPYIENEFTTPLLDRMSKHLWLVATPSSAHISPLHDQRVRGRNVVVSEDPELHLVWINNRVFIKPLPPCLFSYAFWAHYFFPDKRLARAEDLRRQRIFRSAMGYLRSYYYLIRHESDFRIAKSEHLLPQDVLWEPFMEFISAFHHVKDIQVSPRYKYGELRLTRLNFWAKIFLGRWQFRKANWQYADYFARYYAPLLFVLAVFSVALEAMQVGVQARPSWDTFAGVSAWFSVVSLCVVVATLAFLVLVFAMMAGREIVFAVAKQLQGPQETTDRANLNGPANLDEEACLKEATSGRNAP